MKNVFMLNWSSGDSCPALKNKISNFHLEGGVAKFFLDKEIEVFMTIAYDAIAVACSNEDCTLSRTWKEKGIGLDEIQTEITQYLLDCDKKLIKK